ncbi:MAG: EI24 domain-containing protein [Burkholderiaceae bacterium]|nr:EI24 domain-containing protein [Burkholderiaceae bacterium]
MPLLIDSSWRALVYCFLPRVLALSLLPFIVMVAVLGALIYWFWTPTVAWAHQALDSWPMLSMLWNWMGQNKAEHVQDIVAPLLVIFVTTPVIVLLSVLVVASLITPALTQWVAQRRFPALERKRGVFFAGSILNAFGATVLALVALIVSIPLWFVPMLALVLPPLIWGWLTYRIIIFDVLTLYASPKERKTLLCQYRWPLLTIGVVCGYLSTLPSIVWASGLLFAAAFVVLVPLAVWIYMLVLAFSALWFAHYGLSVLVQLRAQVRLAPSNVASTGINTAPRT